MGRREPLHGQWSSRIAFIFAATGAAVGLGNIWKFPYITGLNGGGAFVAVYLLFVLAIALPVMMAEVMLGRRGRRNPINAMRLLSEEETGKTRWQIVGWLGVLTGMLILSYYSVIGGWTIDYALRTVSGTFAQTNAAGVREQFAALAASPWRMLLWHTVFMLLTVLVVARGVEQGLEKALKYLMPLLFVLLLVMVGYAMTTGHFMQGLRYMFDFNISELSADGILMAMGQAFFSLSIGMGAIMAYGAYLPEDASIGGTTLSVALMDTTVALLTGIMLFPIVFANGLDPAHGPGLLFLTLPLAFGQMTAGTIFGALFFLLLVFAAWTSSIGLIEPAVARLVEHRQLRRSHATWIIGGIIWLLGLISIFSFNVLRDVRPFGRSLFANLDFFTSNILLPFSGFMIAVFAGWVMCRGSSTEELELGAGNRYSAWRLLIRFVAPVAMLLVSLHALGLLEKFLK
ncbi:MAG TPA: sodium-dependent transporter [Gammaproteobacteria bacterium]|nr:sodium-dependent transporter [Gammaproteobacteria bacterium]